MPAIVKLFLLLLLTPFSLCAQPDWPSAKEADWIANDFTFHTGETMDLRLHYTTLGNPTGIPILLLHGTTGSGASFLTANFAGQLFGPGQLFDAKRYYIILPDAIGHGKSTKPSDGLRAQFPRYNYQDMVHAQYRLVTEGLGMQHLYLVMGNSMGGMHTWLWGINYPTHMDALIPMAAQPTEMASRNWMLRRLITDSIRRDPNWNQGNYLEQPKSAQFASIFYDIATNGGTLAWQHQAPTWETADRIVSQRLEANFSGDANDLLYQWDASRDYRSDTQLDNIQAKLLAINAADDERNPPETGLMEQALKQVKQGQLYLIPASHETRGHGTTNYAKYYLKPLNAFLQSVPWQTDNCAKPTKQ